MKKILENLIEQGLLKEEKIDFSQVVKVLQKSRNSLMSAKILLAESQEENAYTVILMSHFPSTYPAK